MPIEIFIQDQRGMILPNEFAADDIACRPVGDGCTFLVDLIPHRCQRSANSGVSSGVEMIRIPRIPASISVQSG